MFSFKRINRLPTLLFILLISISAYPQTDVLNELDIYIENARQEWETPGLAIAIVQDDSIIFAKGYGVREIGKEGKVDERTLFAVASNTKAFTAALLGMLVEEGKLDWDDRVIDYLEDFRMYDPYVTREIRIRDLLTHRSGLPTFGGDHLWIGGSHSRDEIVSRLRYLEPTAPFRYKYQYQNLMFLAAGQIIPEVTGKSWDEFIEERILNPLGMIESNVSVKDLRELKNVATPHEFVNGKLKPIKYDEVDNVAPAGALNSNVTEMAQWMMLNLNNGIHDGEQIIGSEIVREMQSVQFPIPVSTSTEKQFDRHFAGYGLGWGIKDYKGYKIISHGGALSGMISRQTLAPEKKLGVIILTNFAPNSLPRALSYQVLDAFLGGEKKDWSQEYLKIRDKEREIEKKREEELREKRVRGTAPSLELEDYSGRYFDGLSGEAEIRLEGGKLVFDYNPRHIGDLEHWHYNTFRLIWRHPIFDMPAKSFLTFYMNEIGEIKELEVTFYDPITFMRLEGEEGSE